MAVTEHVDSLNKDNDCLMVISHQFKANYEAQRTSQATFKETLIYSQNKNSVKDQVQNLKNSGASKKVDFTESGTLVQKQGDPENWV